MEFLPVTAISVGKVLVAAIIAARTSRNIPAVGNTIKDLSFIITNLLVPCLFVSRMAASFTVSVLETSAVLVLFSFFCAALGCAVGALVAWLLFPFDAHVKQLRLLHAAFSSAHPMNAEADTEASRCFARSLAQELAPTRSDDEANHAYSHLMVLGCSFQNTVVVPLSLLMSMHSSGRIPWIDFDAGLAYIFVYNVAVTVVFWSGGAFLMRKASHEEKARAPLNRAVRVIQCSASKSDSASGLDGSITLPCDVSNSLDLVLDAVRLGPDAVVHGAHSGRRAPHQVALRLLQQVGRSLVNAPFVAMVVGVVIGLVPFLRHLFLDGYARVLYDAMYILGEGTVPCAVLLLGGNLGAQAAARREERARGGGNYMDRGTSPLPPNDAASCASDPIVGSDTLDEPPSDNHEDGEGAASTPLTCSAVPPNSFASSVTTAGSSPILQSQPTTTRSLAPDLQRDLAQTRGEPTSPIPRTILEMSQRQHQLQEYWCSSEEDRAEEDLVSNEAGQAAMSVAVISPIDQPQPSPLGWAEDAGSPSPPPLHLPPSTVVRSARWAEAACTTVSTSTSAPPYPLGSGIDATTQRVEFEARNGDTNTQRGSHPQSDPDNVGAAAGGMTRVLQPLTDVFELHGVSTRFVFAVPLIRLVVCPAIAIMMIHLLVAGTAAASNKTLMLILILEVCAPTAINTSLMTNLYAFRPQEYAKMLLYQYGLAVLSSVCWLSFALWYIGN